MKHSLPLICLAAEDVSLAFEHWFCARYDIGFPAVIDHRFGEDGSASLLVIGLGTEVPARKNLGKEEVGQSLQLWLDYERPRLRLMEFLPEEDGSAVIIAVP